MEDPRGVATKRLGNATFYLPCHPPSLELLRPAKGNPYECGAVCAPVDSPPERSLCFSISARMSRLSLSLLLLHVFVTVGNSSELTSYFNNLASRFVTMVGEEDLRELGARAKHFEAQAINLCARHSIQRADYPANHESHFKYVIDLVEERLESGYLTNGLDLSNFFRLESIARYATETGAAPSEFNHFLNLISAGKARGSADPDIFESEPIPNILIRNAYGVAFGRDHRVRRIFSGHLPKPLASATKVDQSKRVRWRSRAFELTLCFSILFQLSGSKEMDDPIVSEQEISLLISKIHQGLVVNVRSSDPVLLYNDSLEPKWGLVPRLEKARVLSMDVRRNPTDPRLSPFVNVQVEEVHLPEGPFLQGWVKLVDLVTSE
jgi:hypothetical protein